MKTPEERALELVEARAVAHGDGEWRPFELVLAIEAGWHVNANPASLEFLIPTRVEGRVRNVEYPQGKEFRFAFAEEELSVYEGRVRLQGEVHRGEDKVRLTYQACDDRTCLPPVTRDIPLSRPE